MIDQEQDDVGDGQGRLEFREGNVRKVGQLPREGLHMRFHNQEFGAIQFLAELLGDRNGRRLAQVINIASPSTAIFGETVLPTASMTFWMTQSGLASLVSRACRIICASLGAAATMNQGSTAMQ